MSTAAEGIAVPRATAKPRVLNPWIVALAVIIPTFMEVLDTTIANVALRYIAGGLSAPSSDSEWVITSYLAANAIILPMSGWLSVRLGRRRYFLLSIAVFTLASVLCGVATNLEILIAARVLQGLAGGGLQPSSQGVLLDAFPPEKQGSAMTLFGIAAPPVVLQQGRARPRLLEGPTICDAQKGAPFDTIGLCLLSFTMICWEIVLSKGQEWDWLGDPFYRVHALLVLFVLGLVTLVWRELRIPNPLINFRTLADQNFRWSCIIIFCAFGVLYANTTTLPALLQSLFGYDATTSGLVLSPSGLFAVMGLVIVGILMSRGVDARYFMAVGVITMGIGNYWTSQLTLDISPWQVVWPRVVVIAGLSMTFAPLNVAAFLYIPKELRAAAVGLLALLRNEGGSVGTSIAKTIHERRDQFHSLRLGEDLDLLNPAVNSFLEQAQSFFLQFTGDPAAARQMALQLLDNLRQQQSSAFAYFDTFLVFAALSVPLVALVFMMRRSVAQKGAHTAAE